MKAIFVHRMRAFLLLVALLIVTFNIFGFYLGFLRIRLRKEEKNLLLLLRRPIAATTLSDVINVPSALTSLPRHAAEPHSRRTASRRVPTSFPSPKTVMTPQPRRVTLKPLKGQDSPCVLSDGRSRDDGTWYNFSDTSFRFYAYSAFLDDRSRGFDNTNASLVRIIALGTELDDPELEKNMKRFSCVLHFDLTDGSDPKLGRSTIVVPMVVKARPIGFGWDLNEVKLKEYIFSCVAHTPAGSPPPRAVTVLTSPDRLNSVTSCVPIEVPAKPRVKQDIAICVQASYGRLDLHRIVEWLELQRILGVSRVGVYDHDLDPDGPGLGVLRRYDAEGLVELRKTDPLPIPGDQQLLLHGAPVINDCMYRYMHSYRWIFVIDFDEVLVPRRSYSLREMVADLERMTSQKTPPPINYLFLNQYYFLDSPPDPTVPNSYTILRYRKTPPTTRQGVAMKSYVDPERCAQMHNHYCMGLIEGLNATNVFEFVDPSMGTSNHYKRCHMTPVECQDILRNTTDDDVIMKYSVELRRSFVEKVKQILA